MALSILHKILFFFLLFIEEFHQKIGKFVLNIDLYSLL